MAETDPSPAPSPERTPTPRETPSHVPADQGIMADPDIRRTIRGGLLIIILFFGGLIGWAGLAEIDSAAIAPGKVMPGGHRRTVEHLEGGIIKSILVRDGAKVEAGQPLIKLEGARSYADFGLAENRLYAALARRARLIAERDGRAEINFPDELKAATGREEVAALIRAESRILTTTREGIESRKAIFHKKIAQLKNEISGLAAEIQAQDSQIAIKNLEIRDLETLVNQGLGRRPQLLGLRADKAKIEGERAHNVALMARAEQAIGETSLEIEDLDKTHLQAVMAALLEAEALIAQLRQEYFAAKDIYHRSVITAPVRGIVVGLQEFTLGGVIKSGEAILEIVPSDEPLMIEARVSPRDIDVVHVGQKASIRLTAYNRRMVRPVHGKLVFLSADSLMDTLTGEPYFLARVVLDEQETTAEDQVQLTPGMEATVMIITGSRTMLEYLFRPILNAISQAFRDD